MANEYLKPQIPLKDLNSENYFYPLTTLDQVQKTDGSRVQEYELGNVALENSEATLGPGASEMSALMNAIYPIGSIYMSVNPTSPSSLFGGTWDQIQDTFLLAAGSNYSAGSTGGSTTHTHNIAHTHTVAHSHTMAHTHTMTHTHPQVATTSGGPSNNTSGGTAITVAQMAAHTHGSKSLTGSSSFRDIGNNDHNLLLFASGILSAAKTTWSGAHDAAQAISKNPYYYNNLNINATHEHASVGSGSAHTHTLSSHTHTTAATTTGAASNATTSASSNANTGETTPTTSAASNEISGSTSTLPPYLVVYVWKRIS